MSDDRAIPATAAKPQRRTPIVWGNVPQRNKNFTGREGLLDELRRQVVAGEAAAAVLAHSLHGMGGVGKTQLAVEYAYRFMAEYEVVWWISADQVALVRSSLAALAPRLGLQDVGAGRLEDAVNAVLDALRRGDPYERWLVIFDNADQPEEIRDFMPTGPGHVIVTSRNHRWEAITDVVEVDVFTREESLEFLRRRVSGITEADSVRLAEELGDLPLALEQAGALQTESGMAVAEYLELLAKESSKVLAESPPADYPVGAAAAWSLSVAQLKEQTPFAWELLRRCAFFGPEPIRRDLLKSGRYLLGPPLRDGLGDTLTFSRATRELGRYALARVDNNRKTLQVHRLIQKLIRDDLDVQEAEKIRHEVHLLLAAADPDDPEDTHSWPVYGELLAHLVPAQAVTSSHPDVRRLVRNVVRYLYSAGHFRACLDLSQSAHDQWTSDSGHDDVDVLALSAQQAELLWIRGQYPAAFELRRETLERMRVVLGENHEATLQVTNDFGADLRAQGDFTVALNLDKRTLERHKEIFGEDDIRTFKIANNVAIDYKLNSDYEAALATDTRSHRDRLDFFGRDDHPWVIHSLSAVGTDLRDVGRYNEALQTDQQAYDLFADLVRQRTLPADHPWVLWQAKDLSVIRRRMGFLEFALALAEDIYAKYVASFGEGHPDTLVAAMNLGNARRVYGDIHGDTQVIERADTEIEAVFQHYADVYGESHPYTYGSALNLAILRRRLGDKEGAKWLLQNSLNGLQQRLGREHHYTLICMTALATSLSETGDAEGAKDLGQRALDGLYKVLGADHPHTLACSSNLSIDMMTLGERVQSERLRSTTLERYQKVLSPDHFETNDAANAKRIDLDFDPPPL